MIVIKLPNDDEPIRFTNLPKGAYFIETAHPERLFVKVGPFPYEVKEGILDEMNASYFIDMPVTRVQIKRIDIKERNR